MRAVTGMVTVCALALVAVTAACSNGGSSAGSSPTQPSAQVGGVQGTVSDGSGAAVSGAGLMLSAAGQSALSTASSAAGSFSFGQVPVGAWTLAVTAPAGYTIGAQSSVGVTVAAGQTASATFTLTRSAPPPPQSGAASVGIAEFSFAPAGVTIAAGGTVTWQNNGSATHTATVDSGSEFDSGNLAPGASFSHTFNTKGTFTYHCAIHPTMKATVTVQ